ncbi:MAG: hypothetical protein ACFFDH_26000 [Promethearchaeota archaeon]
MDVSVIADKSINVGIIIKRYNKNREAASPPKNISVLKTGFALGTLNACLSTLLPIRKHPYRINQDVKKKYVMTETKNKTIRTIEINNIIGKEITKNKATFQGGYSKMFFLEARESKNKNIKNTKKGKKIIMPMSETIGSG